ncbi:DUF7455 domain-containing protein [Actinomycetospora aeridis]|uniref:DUF7455 domain-containing protein n=1 Tax=Actinomycetospora aeridis TaxID=3129231 RepID=A0ABU8NC99_9PSEU
MTIILEAPQQATRENCDRCGVRASSVATFPGGGELTFCGHHGRAHRDRLLAAGAALRPLP